MLYCWNVQNELKKKNMIRLEISECTAGLIYRFYSVREFLVETGIVSPFNKKCRCKKKN